MIEKTDIAMEKARHYVGEIVSVCVFNEAIVGEIVGIYPHFASVKTGNYVRSVQWSDFVISNR